MPVYRTLREIDVLQTVLTTGRRIDAVSGTSGWRGADISGSVSVYAGVRGPNAGSVRAVPTYSPSIYDTNFSLATGSGVYPSTASLHYIDLKLEDRTETHTEWGNRSWRPVERLYEFYSRYNPVYTTSSWDYQCVSFKRRSRVIVMSSDQGNNSWWQSCTSSMTLEAWVKPFSTSSLNYNGYTISSVSRLFRMYVTGTDGRLAFSSSLGIHTSSLCLSQGRWNHVAVSLGNGTGSLYVNLGNGKDFNYSGGGLQISSASFSPLFCIGNVYQSSLADMSGEKQEQPGTAKNGVLSQTFHGLIQDVRLWNIARTWTQISSSHNRPISSGSTGLVKYFRPNEGYRNGATAALLGSSSIDKAANTGSFYFVFSNYSDAILGNEQQVSWTPCDNPLYYPEKKRMLHYASGTSPLWNSTETRYTKDHFKVINIPRIFYGSQISTGSLKLVCRSFSNENREMIRVIRDDGRGGLYIRSYMSSSMDDDSDQYVPWNTVGNIFYSEGVIVLTDDSLLDFGTSDHQSAQPTDLFSISFKGQTKTPVKMISCRVGGAEANASLNQTYAVSISGSEKRRLVDDSRTTYITAVGLYDENMKLVGIAKLASPLRKREGDRFNIRLRMDF